MTIIELFEWIIPDILLKTTDPKEYNEVKWNPSRGKYLLLGNTVVIHNVCGWYVIIRTGEFKLIKLLNYGEAEEDTVMADWQSIPGTEEGFFQYGLYNLSQFTPTGLSNICKLYNDLARIIHDGL